MKNFIMLAVVAILGASFFAQTPSTAEQSSDQTANQNNAATPQAPQDIPVGVAKLEEVVPPQYIEQLKATQKIELLHEADDTELTLLPICEYSQNVRDGKIYATKKQVPFNAEYLYIVPKNDGDDSVIEGVKANTIDMSIIFRSLSRMKGMRYHFEKKKTELLYKDAYMIADPTEKVPTILPDPIEGSADGLTGYCLQDDHSYGKLRYKVSYRQNATTVYTEFHLANAMTCLGQKIVEPGNMKVVVISIDCGDCILLYMGTDSAAKKIPLVNMRKQMRESMAVRIEAIYRWFLKEL